MCGKLHFYTPARYPVSALLSIKDIGVNKMYGLLFSIVVATTVACGEVEKTTSLKASTSSDSEQSIEIWYAVTRVEEDDVLNMRSGPTARSDIIYTIPHDAENLRLLDISDDWANVYYLGHSGWVYGRYLKAKKPVTLKTVFGAELQCIGTEPHWHLSSQREKLTLGDRESEKKLIIASQIRNSVNRTDTWLASFGVTQDPSLIYHAVIQTQACDDGMSDRSYPYHIHVINAYDSELMSGCCEFSD